MTTIKSNRYTPENEITELKELINDLRQGNQYLSRRLEETTQKLNEVNAHFELAKELARNTHKTIKI